jgi:predicted nucleic acid-binding protein
MTVYAETSAPLRWLFEQAQAAIVLEHLKRAARVVCSRLTLVELRRVVQRAVATGELGEAQAEEVLATVARTSARWTILEITRDVTDRAESRFPREPLRTLDAMHLASALVLRQSLPELQVLSVDARVRENARLLGFEVLPADVEPAVG